ncbi:MAG: DUF1549 domain-containing protein [Verrucomicrobiales bacterium]
MFPPVFHRPTAAATALFLSAAGATVCRAAGDAEAIAFFEREVRPVLAENCYDCHGEKKQHAALRLDSRAAVLRGGDFGAAVEPGNPAGSRLVNAIRHEGDQKMPKDQPKLPDAAVAAIEKWIAMGVPWPEEATAKQPGGIVDFGEAMEFSKAHWAFQPIEKPRVPAAPAGSDARNEIDRFILAALGAQGMEPNPPADPRILFRRLSLDLTGLPPSAADADAYAANPTPEAFAAAADRMLESPRYGERWGRHWLDVARYGDTKGYLPGNTERRYPYAYTYRDWVIRALNADLPYDRFLKLQIAADLYTDAQAPDRSDLAALGFLTTGQRFLNSMPDIIDDRIDVVTRGMLGVTATCARCHDHKFDPISTRDYYALYGIFNATQEPEPVLMRDEPERTPGYLEFEKQLNAIQAEADGYARQRYDELRTAASIKAYLALALDAGGKDLRLLAGERKLLPRVGERWKQAAVDGKAEHAVWRALHALHAAPEGEYPQMIAALTAGDAAPLNAKVAEKLMAAPPANRDALLAMYGDLLAAANAPEPHADPAQEALRDALLDAAGFPADGCRAISTAPRGTTTPRSPRGSTA